jgi:hypothetical protein
VAKSSPLAKSGSGALDGTTTARGRYPRANQPLDIGGCTCLGVEARYTGLTGFLRRWCSSSTSLDGRMQKWTWNLVRRPTRDQPRLRVGSQNMRILTRARFATTDFPLATPMAWRAIFPTRFIGRKDENLPTEPRNRILALFVLRHFGPETTGSPPRTRNIVQFHAP